MAGFVDGEVVLVNQANRVPAKFVGGGGGAVDE